MKSFAKPLLIGFLLVLIAFSPFGFHEVSAAGFCDLGIAQALCHPIATVVADVLMIPLVFSAWLLWLSGVFLNTVITYTVIELPAHINGITGINIAWATIRDLSNMVFIFVLLYVAIGTILGIGKADWKNTLKNIVIAAVLINFSLLGTKIIIDASNIFTLGIYKQIVPDSYTLGGGGISNVIMKPLGLSSLYNPVAILGDGNAMVKKFDGELTQIAISSIGSSVFMFITAGIFFGVTSMFIIRYITFIFLLILSPVWVMSNVLPQLGPNAKKWQSQLTGQAIFAPIFMILLWVALTIINSPGFLCVPQNGTTVQALGRIFNGGPVTTPLAPGACTETGLVLNFVIIIAFLSGILKIAQDTSNQAGGEVQKLVASALGRGSGAVGWAGRNTIGRFGKSYASDTDRQAAQNKPGLEGFKARMQIKAGQAAEKGSFDARGAKSFLGQDIKNLNLGGIASGKDGYAGYKKAQGEKTKARNESVRQAEVKRDIQTGIGAPAGSVAHTTMVNRINRMTSKEVEGLSAKQLQDPEIISNLSPQQFEAVMKSDKFIDADKEKIKNVRFNDITTAFGAPAGPARLAGLTALRDRIRGLTTSELEALDPSYLSDPEFVDQLSTSQVSEIFKSNRFTQTQKSAVRGVRSQLISKALEIGSPTYNVANAQRRVRDLDAKDVAGLIRADYAPMVGAAPQKVLLNKDILSSLTSQKLKAMALVMDPADIAAVRTAIQTTHAAYAPLDRLRTWLGTQDADNNFN